MLKDLFHLVDENLHGRKVSATASGLRKYSSEEIILTVIWADDLRSPLRIFCQIQDDELVKFPDSHRYQYAVRQLTLSLSPQSKLTVGVGSGEPIWSSANSSLALSWTVAAVAIVLKSLRILISLQPSGFYSSRE